MNLSESMNRFYNNQGRLSEEFRIWVLKQHEEMKVDMLTTLKEKKDAMFADLLDLFVSASEIEGGLTHETLKPFLD